MNKHSNLIILFLSILVSLGSISIADMSNEDIYNCIEFGNIECENCVVIKNIDIILKDSSNENLFYVGNRFHYNITLMNIGKNEINKSFTVNVYNPQKNIGGSIFQQEKIDINQNRILFPYKNETRKIHDLYDFSISGDYSIKIDSPELTFYKFYEGCSYSINKGPYNFYFDVMPRWEYLLHKKQKEILEKQKEILEKQSTLIEKQETQQEQMINLTLLLMILTTILVIMQIEKYIKKARFILTLEGAFISLVLIFFTLQYSSIWYFFAFLFMGYLTLTYKKDNTHKKLLNLILILFNFSLMAYFFTKFMEYYLPSDFVYLFIFLLLSIISVLIASNSEK